LDAFPVRREILDLLLTPGKLFGGNCSPEQLVDQPNPIGVHDIAFAVAGDLLDLPSPHYFLDATAVDAFWLARQAENLAHLVSLTFPPGTYEPRRSIP